jgi:tRNA-specific 2-thiouridylase
MHARFLFKRRMCISCMAKVKALALFSGGLDSILAVKLILKQSIDVVAVNFFSAFCLCAKDECGVVEAAKKLGVPLKVVELDHDYLKIIRKPKHGYGKNMNPCVDCRIFILKKAKKYAKEIGADFIFTGEVLDERPMSQHFGALKTIEEESDLKGKILRPLSAKLLPETVIERKGLVNRKKLLNIRGRSRKPQFKLAEEFNIVSYPSPAGGCLLTCREYSNKLRDLFKYKKRCSMADVALLSVGRHFRLGRNKIILGRNEAENKVLIEKKLRNDYYFEVPDVGSPITILQGVKTQKAIKKAAALTAFYSDAKISEVTVNFGRESLSKRITVLVPARAEVESLRIDSC